MLVVVTSKTLLSEVKSEANLISVKLLTLVVSPLPTLNVPLPDVVPNAFITDASFVSYVTSFVYWVEFLDQMHLA